MPDLNDVVRHVILRISVDQKGLGEELAAARAKLKGLKDAEAKDNADRVKSIESVNKALAAQSTQLGENARAHDAAHRAADGKSGEAAAAIKAQTEQIKEQTKAVKDQILEEAKADAVAKKARQDELTAIAKRSASKKKDQQDEAAAEEKLEADRKRRHQDELDRVAKRSAAKKKAAQDEADAEVKLENLKKSLADKRSTTRKDSDAKRSNDAARVEAGVAKTNAEAEKIKAAAEDAKQKTRNAKLDAQTKRVNETAKAVAVADDIAAKTELTKERAEAVRDQRARAKSRDQQAQAAQSQRAADAGVKAAESLRKALDAQQASQEKADAKRGVAAARNLRRQADEVAAAEAAQEAQQRRENQQARIAQDRLIKEDAAERKRLEREAKQQNADANRVAKAQDAGRIQDPVKAEDAAYKEYDKRTGLVSDRVAAEKAAYAQQDKLSAAHARQVQRDEREINAGRVTSRVAAEKAAYREADRLDREFDAARLRRDRETEIRRRQNKTSPVAAYQSLQTDLFRGLGATLFGVGKADDLGTGPFEKISSRIREASGETRKYSVVAKELFKGLKDGGVDAESTFKNLALRARSLFRELKPESSGGGGLFGTIIRDVDDLGSSFLSTFGGMGRSLFTIQSLVILVIAAFGPLVAIIGAVGAAALGLAANLGALVGVLFALPGLLTAAVAGFGALFIAIKPLVNVFSAYSAAQKEATANTNAAKDAQLDLKSAILQSQQAQLAYNRAIEDKPRLQLALNDARKQASRDIEDYRTQLQRLKFDEEGAALGTESAEFEYRKALADPTLNNLQRRIAKHAYEQSIIDSQDQATQARRTGQDANEAIGRGVEGSDAVINARRALQDLEFQKQSADIARQKAELAQQKAKVEADAGGAAGQKFKSEVDKLDPATKKVFYAIIALKDQFKALQAQISGNIFGPLSAQTGQFAGILESVGRFLTPASKVIGDLIGRFVALLNTDAWKQFFTAQGNEAASTIEKLGGAVFGLAEAFRGIVTAAQPLVDYLVAGIEQLAISFGKWANSTAGQKSLTDFLLVTQQVIGDLAPIIGDFALGFAGFFKALTTPANGEESFLTTFNDGFAKFAATFAALGAQAADPNSGFRQWLHDVKPLLSEINHFLGETAKFFGSLFENRENIKEAERILRNIADKWLPALQEIFEDLSKSGAVSKVVDAIGSVFKIIEEVLDHGGLLGIQGIATAIQLIANVFAWMIEHIPGLNILLGITVGILGVLVGVAMIGNVAKFVGKFTGLFRVLQSIRDLAKGDLKNALSALFGISTSGSPKVDKNGNVTTVDQDGKKTTVNKDGTSTIVDKDGNKTTVDKSGKATTVDKSGKKINVPAGTFANELDDAFIKRDLAVIIGLLERIAINTGSLPGDVVTGGGDTDGKGDKNTKPTTPGGEEPKVVPGGKGSTSWWRKLLGKGARATEGGGKAATAARLGVGLLKGLAITAAIIAGEQVVDEVIDANVKDDEDKGSLTRGTNAVATGGNLGLLFGAPGAAIGATIGGSYSIFKDKNLRDFLENKVPGSTGLQRFIQPTAVNTKPNVVQKAGRNFLNGLFGPVGPLVSAYEDWRNAKANAKSTDKTTASDVTTDISAGLDTAIQKAKTFKDTAAVGLAALGTYFTDTLPKQTAEFFDKKVPAQARAAWTAIQAALPIGNLFAGIGQALTSSNLINAIKGKKSGGLIDGVYQGIEDTVMTLTTPDEFVVRRSRTQQPGAKAFLNDFNEGRITMADLYGGLASSTAPNVMSIVPPDARALTGPVPTVVNHTVNHAPLMGDVTIHNPVREKSEHSLRRQVQIAAIRHRR